MTRGFQRTQAVFAAHLRDPASNPAPSKIEDRRMAVYRELFFNNVRGFIEQAFPVLGSILGEERGLKEIRQFWQSHSCESPYFIHISRSFLDYLVNERTSEPNDPPFMLELAHYEWVELDVSVRRHEQLDRSITPEQINAELALQVSDLAWPLQYQFPVHQIRFDYQPEEPLPHGVYLVVSRDPQGEVQFLEINAVTAKLVELIQAKPGLSVALLIESMTSFLPQYSLEQLTAAVIGVVSQLAEREILRQPVQP